MESNTDRRNNFLVGGVCSSSAGNVMSGGTKPDITLAVSAVKKQQAGTYKNLHVLVRRRYGQEFPAKPLLWYWWENLLFQREFFFGFYYGV